MKTTDSKKISQISSTIRKFLSLAAAAAFVTVPLLGAVTASEAAPKRHKSSKTTKKRDHRYKSRNNRSNRNPRYNSRDNRNNSRNNRNQRYNSRDNRYNRAQVFHGAVTKIKGNRTFDIRVNGKIYNVTTSGSMPRNLRRNDQVRVEGVRYGSNDINNARVTIVRRR